MKLYADAPGRTGRQIAGDVLVVAWLWLWIWLAMRLYHLVEKLAVPGQKLAGAGDGMAGGLTDAGGKLGNLPAVGSGLAAPFNRAAAAARAMAAAGREQQAAVHDLAWALALLLLLVPVAIVLLVWLPLRLRWIARASAASALREGTAGRDLLALRALANQPLRRLARVDPDPVAAWRRADETAVAALAALELRRLGLRS